jgi:hypothetical protein
MLKLMMNMQKGKSYKLTHCAPLKKLSVNLLNISEHVTPVAATRLASHNAY